MQMSRVVIRRGGSVNEIYEMPTSKLFRKNGQFVACVARVIHYAAQNTAYTVTIESFSTPGNEHHV